MDKILQPIDIKFTDVVYAVPVPKQKEKKQVLKGISGKFKSGELTAIMGPSGAGKSSLLNVLTGFSKRGVEGSLQFGDTTDLAKSRKVCSYILQDDNLYPLFTVQETMMTAANLKISTKSKRTKQTMIDNILESLHLEHTKNTKCSRLSGGQKKRLSIALELLDNPQVLFLDEPTTGLDSSSSAYCVRLLHNLAHEGRTIVCTIHQPSATVFETFDHVYVLAEGNCIYQGSAYNTISYLSSVGLHCPQYHSPADYLIEIANGDYGNFQPQLAKAATDNRWRSSQMYILDQTHSHNSTDTLETDLPNRSSICSTDISTTTKSSTKSQSFDTPSEWYRLWVLIGRCYVLFYRDWTVTHLKLLCHILCGVLIGLFYGDSGINATKFIYNIGLLLIGIIYLWYTTMMPGILRFPLEIAIIKKETFNNWYKLRTYFIASLIISIPIHILFASVFSSITFFLTSQPVEMERFLKYLFIMVLVTISSGAYGIFLGTIFNPVNGTFIGAITTCFLLVFAGFLAMFRDMPYLLRIISYLSFQRYGLEALVLSLYDNGRSNLICPDNVVYCHFRYPPTLIEELGMKPQNFQYDILMMCLQMFIINILGYFGLKRRIFKN